MAEEKYTIERVIIKAAVEARAAQKQYFSSRTPDNLTRAKKKEEILDAFLGQYLLRFPFTENTADQSKSLELF